MHREVLAPSIKGNTFARWRAAIMATCKNSDTDECLLATRKMWHFFGLLAMKTQFRITLFSRKSIAGHPTERTSQCASSKRLVLINEWATDLLRRSNLAFRDVAEVSFMLDCFVLPNAALNWRSCGFWLQEWVHFQCSWSQTPGHQPDLWPGGCFCRTRVESTTLWAMLHPSDEGATESKSLSTGRTRLRGRHLLHLSYGFFLSRRAYSGGAWYWKTFSLFSALFYCGRRAHGVAYSGE